MKTICLLGAFDTKGAEYAFVREQILARGHEVLTVNTGIMGSTDLFPVDLQAYDIAQAGGGNQPFCDREADRAMFDAVKANLREGIEVVELDNNINDPEFSAKAVEMMLALIKQTKERVLRVRPRIK